MWPFSKKKPDDLTEILVKEMETLAGNAGDWSRDRVLCPLGYSIPGAIKHECGNAIAPNGSLISAKGHRIDLDDGQMKRLSACYKDIVTTWALSSCIKKTL